MDRRIDIWREHYVNRFVVQLSQNILTKIDPRCISTINEEPWLSQNIVSIVSRKRMPRHIRVSYTAIWCKRHLSFWSRSQCKEVRLENVRLSDDVRNREARRYPWSQLARLLCRLLLEAVFPDTPCTSSQSCHKWHLRQSPWFRTSVPCSDAQESVCRT